VDIKNDTEFIIKFRVAPPAAETYTVLVEPEEWLRAEENADVFVEAIYREVTYADKKEEE